MYIILQNIVPLHQILNKQMLNIKQTHFMYLLYI